MEPKKISFGFSKVKKKPNLLPQQPTEKKDKVEYITSFDKDTLKLSEKKEELIIPVKTNYSVGERITEKKRKETEAVSDPASSSHTNDDKLSIEQLAINELLTDSKKLLQSDNASTMAIPMNETAVKASEEPANYDDVPVSQFGYAMLRGMGWAPGKGIGKKQKVVDVHVPELRARGLGLGADAPAKD